MEILQTKDEKREYLFKYLDKVKNLSFDELKLNIIDALIFSTLSYYRFDFMMTKENKKLTLEEASKIYFLDPELPKFVESNAKRNPFLKELAASKRFKDLILFNYINEFDENADKQFGAISIMIDKNTCFISFRGTDKSLTGIKEDLNMSYVDVIGSQVSADRYVHNKIYKKFNKIYLGGHSKGGNLAIYASYKSTKSFKDNIRYIFNFDGPGFKDEIIESKRFELIREKIITVVPEMSLVGMIFNKPENVFVIKSSAFSISQHNPFTWEIDKNYIFKFVNLISVSSEVFNNSVKDYFLSLSSDERGKFVNTIWDVVTMIADEKEKNNVNNIEFLSKTKNLFSNLSESEKETLKKLVKNVIKIIAKHIKITKKEREETIVNYSEIIERVNNL